MRKTLSPQVEKCRIMGEPNSGPMGAFRLFCEVFSRTLQVIVSDGRDWFQPQKQATEEELKALPPLLARKVRERWAGKDEIVLPAPAWEHVSVSTSVVPHWKELCWVKEIFWEDEECVIQYHPPKSKYVNDHPNVLRLWRPVGIEIPMPPMECV